MYLRYIFHLDYEIELIIFDIILHHIIIDGTGLFKQIIKSDT